MKDISLSKRELTNLKELLKKTKPATISKYRGIRNYNLYEISSAICEERQVKARLIEYYRELIQKEIEILNKGEEHPRNTPEDSPFKYDYMNTADGIDFTMFIQKIPHKNITKEDLELALEVIIEFIAIAPLKAYPTSFCKLSEHILYLKCRELFNRKDKESLEKAAVMYRLVEYSKYFQEEYVFKQKKEEKFLKVERSCLEDALSQYKLLRLEALATFQEKFRLSIDEFYTREKILCKKSSTIDFKYLEELKPKELKKIQEKFNEIFDKEYRIHNGTFEINPCECCDGQSSINNPWEPLLETIKKTYLLHCLCDFFDGEYNQSKQDMLEDAIAVRGSEDKLRLEDIENILGELFDLKPEPRLYSIIIRINGDCLDYYANYKSFEKIHFSGQSKTFAKRRKILN